MRILLVGGTLRRNFGGPSIVGSLKALMTKSMPDAKIRVLALWRDSRIEAEGYTEVPFSPVAFLKGCLVDKLDPLRRILGLYLWADVIIDYWGLSFTDAKKRGFFMRVMEGFPMLLGKLLGKPVIKYTADMGPFVSNVTRCSAKFYLNRIDLILARSEETKQQLTELGVRTPVAVCPDTGLLLEPDAISEKDFALLGSACLIGLSVSYVAEQKVGHDIYVDMMAELCDYLVDQFGASVLIIPNEIAPERPIYDDVRVAHRIFEAVNNKTLVSVFDEEFLASYLKGVIAGCQMVVAARYHTVVAALSSGVPTISLSWHEKYRSLMELFGQEEYIVDLGSINIEELEQKVSDLWSDRTVVREEILSHKPAVREGVLKGIRLTKQVIEEKYGRHLSGEAKVETVADVLNRDLCCSCGACAVACPVDAIFIREFPDKGLLGPVVDSDQCSLCGTCLKVCPGYAVDVAELSRQVFGAPPEDFVIGNWDSAYIAWSTDSEIRYNSASGGIATALLCDLLEQGKIDGALVVGDNKERPLRPKAFVARTSEQIKMACGSKYCPVSLDAGLEEIASRPGRYAVVGLPCHLHSVRNLERCEGIFRERIVLHLGLMCGRNSTFWGTEYFLRGKRVDPEAVTSIAYRANGWPGQIRVTLEDGTERCFPRSTSDRSYSGQRLFHSAFHFDFIQPRCLTCFDTFAAFADISLGDAWLPEIKREEKIGKSIVIVRTAVGRCVMDSLACREVVTLEPLAIVRLQSRNLNFARHFSVRMQLLRLMGKAVPEYRFSERVVLSSKAGLLKRLVAGATFLPFLPSFFRVLKVFGR